MISVAAELAGMHPQTLRIYEARGLITPKRSPKNTRLYSQEDVERLRRIQELTSELGMNLAGVERVFELELEIERMRRRMRASRASRRASPAGAARRDRARTALGQARAGAIRAALAGPDAAGPGRPNDSAGQCAVPVARPAALERLTVYSPENRDGPSELGVGRDVAHAPSRCTRTSAPYAKPA